MIGCGAESGQRFRGVTLRSDAGDKTNIGAAVAKAAPAPAGNINTAHGVDIEICRTRHFEQLDRLGGFLKSRALGLNDVAISGPAPPIAGVRKIVPSSGKTRFIDPCRAAARAAAVIGEWLDDLVGEVFEQTWIAVIFKAGEMMKAHV